MSNESPELPVLSIQKIYTKDISFENPNSPEVFLNSENPPKIDLNLGVQNRQIGDDHWEVSIKVSALARDSASEKIIFEVEVEQAGLFLIQNIPVEHMPVVLGVDCPTIVFPYLRQVASQLTVDGGFMPLLLDPFNFAMAFHNSQEEKKQPIQ